MQLVVRIRWRHAAPADLRADVEAHHTVSDLLRAAADECGAEWDPDWSVYIERTASPVPADAKVADCGLVSGDVLRFELYDVQTPPDREAFSTGISCDITSGPEAGRAHALQPGRHEIGRLPGNHVVIGDPTVSDHQLTVVVSEDLDVQLVADPAAVNPLLVNGHAVAEPVNVGANDVVQFGATAVAFRRFARTADAARDQLGQIPFRRTPHRPVNVSERPFKPLGSVPVKPDKRRLSFAAPVVPVASGLGMYLFTKSPYSLMMVAMAPVNLITNWMDSRKASRERFSESLERFRRRLDTRRSDVDKALLAERAERIDQSPDLADLARRANLRTLDLWPRKRDDAEFLRTRLGLGTVPSNVSVDAETSGEEYLRDAVEATMTGYDRLVASPICVELAELGTFGLHGEPRDVRAMCASIILQAATLHSPEDLVVVTLEGRPRGLGSWVKWLPHTRSATSPLAAAHVVEDPRLVGDMLREILAVATARTASDDRSDHRWPWILVVLDESADADPALVSQILELCPKAGISVVAAVGSEARVPRQATATMRCVPAQQQSTVWFTDPDVPERQDLEPEPANPRLINEVAMSLAPLRDATATSATSSIPRVVPLFTLFGAETPTPQSIARTWSIPKPYGLRAPIGVGASGPLELDLVEHGPHALIGGTSGAGKSELLQSIVASLISQYPPTKLNFLFVDYKGGASSTVFADIPHTVGYVTNLDAALSLRALTSLRAELNHRMRLMEGKAKDLAEMIERHPNDAPPSLVIVVDEFATLVKEVPDFVAGIVDIAQRGRSLGIHLILATQRPSGSVNDNILANTNLRISLRMLDGSESQAVIGTKAAADIPVPLKGRAFAKLGPRDLVEFQSAYTGAAITDDAATIPVTVSRFGSMPTAGASSSGTRILPTATVATDSSQDADSAATAVTQFGAMLRHGRSADRPLPPPTSTPTDITVADAAPVVSATPSTQLSVLLAAVRSAMPNLPAPRRPWRETLPEVLPLTSVDRDALGRSERGRLVTVGMLDEPASQSQYPAVFDLEEGGGLLVAGAGGSGKTTALRTIAASATEDASPDDVTLFVIDCASRSLGSLRDLPHTAAVATGDDIESITRVIALLTVEIERRRRVLSEPAVQAESLTAYLDGGHSMPRILVLVDAYQNLAAILGSLHGLQFGPRDWLAEFQKVITDGRQVGVHVILTADRRQAVPALLMSAIGNRLVLRQTDDSGYGDFGVPAAVSRGVDFPDGRGLWLERQVQVALVGDDPAAAAQSRAISELGQERHGDVPAELVVAPPAESVHVPDVAGLPFGATLGRTDVFGQVVTLDVAHSGIVVSGPPRSGRTTALRQLAHSLRAGGVDVWTIGLGPGQPDDGRSADGRVEDAMELLEKLASQYEETPPNRPFAVVVDNADRYDGGTLNGAYDRLVQTGKMRLVGSIETRNLSGYSQNNMLGDLRRETTMLLLQPDTASDVYQATGVRITLRPGLPMTAGRGVYIVNRQPTTIQVAAARE